MEEESAKRRDRLRSMRLEASASSTSSGTGDLPLPTFSVPPPPLPSPSMGQPSAESPYGVPRFDFYTNPMGAFSSAKRRRGGSITAVYSSPCSPKPPPPPPVHPAAGPVNYYGNTIIPPAQQFHMVQSPDHSPYQIASNFPQSSPWRTPTKFPTFMPGNGGSPASRQGSWSRSGSTFGHDFPNSNRGGFTSPRGIGVNPMHSLGRSSPHSSSGRGRGWQFPSGITPRSSSGGRGHGSSYKSASARQEVEHYYIKAMVEDPWRELQPIVGNILVPMSGPRSWLPQSLTAEKNKVIESGQKLNSGMCLAEYLAAAFEETINDT